MLSAGTVRVLVLRDYAGWTQCQVFFKNGSKIGLVAVGPTLDETDFSHWHLKFSDYKLAATGLMLWKRLKAWLIKTDPL
ncbi:MAG: hypothetical protein KDH96_03255 [Candidatus Riesia sp.]|nr:hypothetical protein [Candidatus Riesia sp.]